MAWWIFQNVVITAALALVVAMVSRAGRIGPVARHALWVIVLVKFVTPPVIVWPWAAPNPLGLTTATSTQSTKSTWSTASSESSRSSLSSWNVASGADGSPAGLVIAPASATGAISPGPWLAGIWIAGSLAMLLIELVRVRRLARRLRRTTPADPALVARVAVLAARLGVRPPRVIVCADQTAPAIWCVRGPTLLWPATLPVDVSAACVDGLIVHELAHVKRRDHLVGWIELVAGIAWWWNPLFWFVRAAVREQAELACDAWVISALPQGRRAYAESLLALSSAPIRAGSSMAVIGVRATSRRVLERRLVMIMKGRSPLHLPSVGVLSLALVAAATFPAWATQQTLPPPPAQAPPAARPVPPPPPAPAAPSRVDAMPAPLPMPNDATPAPWPMLAPAAPPPGWAAMPFPPQRVEVQPEPPMPPFPPDAQRGWTTAVPPETLPADGQQLVQGYTTERDAIQKEADQKIDARRAALVKSLQDLQEKYTKAGKLDEAVAIRDYLRDGIDRDKRLFAWIKRR